MLAVNKQIILKTLGVAISGMIGLGIVSGIIWWIVQLVCPAMPPGYQLQQRGQLAYRYIAPDGRTNNYIFETRIAAVATAQSEYNMSVGSTSAWVNCK